MNTKTETPIVLDDDDVVTVDVTDKPDLAAAQPATETGAETPAAAATVAQTAPAQTDEAKAALNQAVKAAEEARRAAEATAASERAAREAAEREARARAAEAEAARTEVQDREATIIAAGLEQAKTQQETAEREWQRAMEAGDYAAAAKAQTAGQKAAAQVAQLEASKAALDAAPKKTPAASEGRVTAGASERAEQYLAGFTPKSQAWLRTHTDCLPVELGGDRTKNAQMMAAHYEALAKGLQPESTEYFQMIEEKVGLRTPVEEAAPAVQSKAADVKPAAPAEAKSATPARKPAPSAPVSRDAPAQPGQRMTRQVTLNAQQKEAATFSFPHLAPTDAYKAYARNLLELEAEGKLGRYTQP